MRTRVDEATIRGLIRESLIRRMLSEADGGGPTLGSLGSLIGSLAPSSAEDSAPGYTLADAQRAAAAKKSTSKYGRPSGSSTLDAIMKVATGDQAAAAEIDSSGEEVLGEKTGRAIINMINTTSAKSDFRPSDPKTVLEDWVSEAPSIDPLPLLGEDGKPSGEKMEFPPNEDGLLRYLIAIRAAEFGLEVTRAHYENTMGLIEDIKPTAKALTDIFDTPVYSWYISEQNMRDAIQKIITFIDTKDTSPDLGKTKMLLAYFGSKNTTGSEAFGTALTIGGIAAAVALVAVGIYMTGGLAAGLVGTGGLSGAASGIASTLTLTGTILTTTQFSVIGSALAGLGYLASQGIIATGAAGMASIVGGIYAATWCGNKMPALSDEYKEFMAAVEDGEGIEELRGEFDSVWSMGDETVEDIQKPLSQALIMIEGSDPKSNIRGQVLALLKKAVNA